MSRQDRAPWFPFYPADWLSDPKVAALTWASQGRYIGLLASMWEHGAEGCRIPRRTAEKLYGTAFVAAIADGPHALITAYIDDAGSTWLHSDRLFQEAQLCKSRSDAAREAARIRWSERNATA